MTYELAMPLWNFRRPRLLSPGWFNRLSLVILIGMALIITGCGFASFVAAAEADLPVAISAVSNILAFVLPGIGSSLATSIGQAMLQSLVVLCGNPVAGATKCDPNSLIGQYVVAPSATLLQKIQVLLSDVNSKIAQIISIANGVITVPQIVVLAVTGGFAIVLQVINAVMSWIPAAAAKFGFSLAIGMAVTNPTGVPLTPTQPPSRANLVKQINAALHSYPQALVQ